MPGWVTSALIGALIAALTSVAVAVLNAAMMHRRERRQEQRRLCAMLIAQTHEVVTSSLKVYALDSHGQPADDAKAEAAKAVEKLGVRHDEFLLACPRSVTDELRALRQSVISFAVSAESGEAPSARDVNCARTGLVTAVRRAHREPELPADAY